MNETEALQARIRTLLNVLHTIASASSLSVIREIAHQAIISDINSAGERSETERGMD